MEFQLLIILSTLCYSLTEEEEAVNDASEENGGTDEQALISREMDEANFTPSDSNSSRYILVLSLNFF